MADSKELPNDLSDFCRVCLQLPEESQYLDLTTIYDEDDHLTYNDCFTICTQIDLKAGIGVPHHLCKPCGLELQMSYDFYKKVEESKRILQQYEKKIQDEINEQELLYKPPTQKVAERKQQKDPDEQLNDATTYFLSPMVVEENDRPQSQNSLEITHDEREYLANSDEENGVKLLSKIEPIKDIVKSDQENEHLVPMGEGMEIEHLEMDDFQNLETLEEEETETLQIQCEQITIPITITKYKHKYIKEEEFYLAEEEEDEANNQANSQEELLDDEEANIEHSKWQENVVAVANKEHIPVEADGNDDQEVEELDFTKDNDFVILSDVSNGESNAKKWNEEKEKESKKANQENQKIKRHVGAHSCDYCQKMFKNYSRMKAHRRCHEVDRTKYGCVHCGRMYATKQAMECHVQTAHEKSGYTCNICNKVFAIRKSLEIHVRYHTGDFPYVCDICGRKFAQAGHLNTHKNVKHNNIRFSCDYPDCGKFFTSSTSLRSHEFSHGLMPFECEYCQLGYPSKTKLRVHIKKKHGLDLTMEQLEKMRKFHVMRSKVNIVKVVEDEEEI